MNDIKFTYVIKEGRKVGEIFTQKTLAVAAVADYFYLLF